MNKHGICTEKNKRLKSQVWNKHNCSNRKYLVHVSLILRSWLLRKYIFGAFKKAITTHFSLFRTTQPAINTLYTFSNTCLLSLFLCPNCLKHDLCVVRSQPMGWHWEAELLPQVGGGAAAGHSLTADLHQRGATQPNNSTVSPISDISENVITL